MAEIGLDKGRAYELRHAMNKVQQEKKKQACLSNKWSRVEFCMSFNKLSMK